MLSWQRLKAGIGRSSGLGVCDRGGNEGLRSANLIPWPGPQTTSRIVTSVVPVCSDIQSSPASPDQLTHTHQTWKASADFLCCVDWDRRDQVWGPNLLEIKLSYIFICLLWEESDITYGNLPCKDVEMKAKFWDTCCDDEVLKESIPRVLQMNAVCVRTPPWGQNGNVEDLNLLAVVKFQMHLRAVLDGNIAHAYINASIELQCLRKREHWASFHSHIRSHAECCSSWFLTKLRNADSNSWTHRWARTALSPVICSLRKSSQP